MTRTEAERLRKATVLLRAAEGRTADALVLMLDMVEQAMRDFDAEDKALEHGQWCPHCGKPATTTACGIGGCPLGADL